MDMKTPDSPSKRNRGTHGEANGYDNLGYMSPGKRNRNMPSDLDAIEGTFSPSFLEHFCGV